MTETTAIESPCVNVCRLDPRTGLCFGCARSVDEIARWAGMTALERRRIMGELDGRRNAAKAAAHSANAAG